MHGFWRPLALRLFGLAGVAQCALPWVSASFAWQAWDNVHCQGLGCTPWRPLGLRLFCVAGVAQCALPRARMYALASLGSPPLWRGRRGTMCTPLGLRLFCLAGVAWATPNGPVSNTFFLVAKTWPISWECSRCLMRLTKPTENAKATHGYESL